MQKLLDFLAAIENLKIYYTLECNSSDAIMVLVSIPGEKWETNFYADGNVQVEVFRSLGITSGDEYLQTLLQEYME